MSANVAPSESPGDEADDIPEDVLSRFPSTLRLLHLARMVFIGRMSLEEAAAAFRRTGEPSPSPQPPQP